MFTNKNIRDRIEQYSESFSDLNNYKFNKETIALLEEDLTNFDKLQTKDRITAIDIDQTKRFYKTQYTMTVNLFMIVFIDYYFNYLSEELEDETVDLFVWLLKVLFFDVSSNKHFTVLGLQSSSKKLYSKEYYSLLSKDVNVNIKFTNFGDLTFTNYGI